MKSMREVMDEHFIEVYNNCNGHMDKTSKILGVSNRTSRNWRHRLEQENKIINITKTPKMNQILKRDKWENRSRWK